MTKTAVNVRTPLKARQFLRSAAGAALIALSGTAAAQTRPEPVPDSVPVPPRDLRDFRIGNDGNVAPVPAPPTSPPPVVPAPTPAPAPVPQPAPASQDPVPAAQEPVRSAPAVTRPVRRPAASARRAAPPVAAPEAAPATGPEAAGPAPLVEPAPAPVETVPAPMQPAPAAPAQETAAPESNRGIWPSLALAGLAAALAAFFLLRRRRRVARDVFVEEQFVEEPPLVAEPEAEPAVIEAPVSATPIEEASPADALPVEPQGAAIPLAEEPRPVAPLVAPAPGAHAAQTSRPHLELAFTPAAASASDIQASVDYALVVTNVGDVPARKVRLEARMFAMGQDHDRAVAEFFAAPLSRPTPIASNVPPGVGAGLRAQVTLPRDAVQPIQVRDRTLFVPLVAFNVLYEWEEADGQVQIGQTAMSYVVGRENRPPAEKMAPLRLDQGPKIYREVGQRVHQLKQVA